MEYVWKQATQRAVYSKVFKAFTGLRVSVAKTLAYCTTYPEAI
jgi:hypothetical protein